MRRRTLTWLDRCTARRSSSSPPGEHAGVDADAAVTAARVPPRGPHRRLRAGGAARRGAVGHRPRRLAGTAGRVEARAPFAASGERRRGRRRAVHPGRLRVRRPRPRPGRRPLRRRSGAHGVVRPRSTRRRVRAALAVRASIRSDRPGVHRTATRRGSATAPGAGGRVVRVASDPCVMAVRYSAPLRRHEKEGARWHPCGRRAMTYLGLGDDEDYADYETTTSPGEHPSAPPDDPAPPVRPPAGNPAPASADEDPPMSSSAATVRLHPHRRPLGRQRRRRRHPAQRRRGRPWGGRPPAADAGDGQAPRGHPHVVQRGPGGRRHLQGQRPGDHEPAGGRPRPVPPADRLRLGPLLRPRRQHGQGRQRRLPAHAGRRRGLRRGPRRLGGLPRRAAAPPVLRSRHVARRPAPGGYDRHPWN